MNKLEAERVAGEVASRYRERPRAELLRLLDEQDAFEIVAPSGRRYQIEVTAVWDDRKGNNLRVFTLIDDGGFLVISPLSVDFIVAPDGRFIGEARTSLAESLGFQTAVDELLATLQDEYRGALTIQKTRMQWRNMPGVIDWDSLPPTLAASPLSIMGSIWNDAIVSFGRASVVELWQLGKTDPDQARANLEWVCRRVLSGDLIEWRSKWGYREQSCLWQLRDKSGRRERGAVNVIIPPLWQILPWRQLEQFAPYAE